VGCTKRRDPDETELWCAIEHAHEALRAAHQTSAFAIAIVRDREALIAFAGDVPIAVRHGAKVDLLGPRLAMQPLGSAPGAQVDVRWIPFDGDDTLVIVSRGLLAAVGLDRVRAALDTRVHETRQLEDTIAKLVDDGVAVRDHAELTAVIAHLVPEPPPTR
jgi:hypothetical protein